MRCKRCMTPLEEDMRFCPECGCPVESDDAGAKLSPPTDADDDRDREAFRLLAAQLEVMEPDDLSEQDATDAASRAILAAQRRAAHDDPTPSSEPSAPSLPDAPRLHRPPEGASQAHLRPRSVAVPYLSGEDSAPDEEEREPDDFDDGYTVQPDDGMGKYRRTSGGKRFGSILLCILTAAMLIFTVLSLSLRLTLTQDHIRTATDAEKMLTRDIFPDSQSAVQWMRGLIAGDSEQVAIPDELIEAALRSGTIPAAAADILNGYADYFLHNKTSACLNAEYITGRLEEFNTELNALGGEYIEGIDTDRIAERINGGDLSYLSIDDRGGYFYRRYDFNPGIAATVGSLPILILCGAIALLCIVMILVINSSNLPAGLNFSGVVLLIVGGFWLSAALGCLILSLIKNFWILCDLLRFAGMWTGILGGGLFVLGLIAVSVAGALKKRARKSNRRKTE